MIKNLGVRFLTPGIIRVNGLIPDSGLQPTLIDLIALIQ